jgi:lipopolysaccharide transport system ATP-binding protein
MNVCDAIVVRNLGKKYRLGMTLSHDTVRDQVAHVVRMLWTRGHGVRNPPPDKGILWALKDVSFNVKCGEVVGIIGANGAGKSTLLKILSQITEPTEGEIAVRGRVGSLLEVGTGMHPELSGRENVYLNGSILGMRKYEIDAKYDAIVDFAGIHDFMGTPIKRYSSGMRVRLGFAIAAHLEPEILVVDEVLAVGDAAFQRKCLGKMRDVSSAGRTVLFVSHNMAAIQALCGRAILLRAGRLVLDGSVAEVLAEYAGTDRDLAPMTDMSAHPHRLPGSVPVIHRFSMKDRYGQEQAQFRLGSEMRFEILLKSESVHDGIRVGIHINNGIGVRVLTFNTAYQWNQPVRLDKDLMLRCDWPEACLVPGRYQVVLSVFHHAQMLDRLEPAAAFRVLPSDVYGTGKLPPERDGVFVPKAVWHTVD